MHVSKRLHMSAPDFQLSLLCSSKFNYLFASQKCASFALVRDSYTQMAKRVKAEATKRKYLHFHAASHYFPFCLIGTDSPRRLRTATLSSTATITCWTLKLLSLYHGRWAATRWSFLTRRTTLTTSASSR